MKNRIRSVLFLCLLLGALLFISGCSGAKTPYDVNDAEDFNVSVRFDANGGTFTTNVTVIVDSFNVGTLDKDGDGTAQIALIAPDDPQRGSGNSFAPVSNDHFLLGWYAERTPVEGGEGYTYSKKWDFEKDRLEVSSTEEHTASEPVMTLYAVWAPLFQIEIFDLGTDELLDTISYDPTLGDIKVPSWDLDKGIVDMGKFPQKKGHTFNGAFYDKEGTAVVDTESVVHTAQIDHSTGTVTDATMKLYVDWLEGEWYHIYTAKQFRDNASLSGNYIIHEDLDFSDEIWPTALMHGNFTGSVQGNGHVFRNIEAKQTNNSKNYAGLFGNVTDKARFQDVTFDNVTYTIEAGSRVVGTNFGLFAGHISEAAVVEDVTITNSVLQIDSGIYFTPDSDYIIGLVCAMGAQDAIDHSGITCQAVGDAPEKVLITVTDGSVDVDIVI